MTPDVRTSSILVVDDEPTALALIIELLRARGYTNLHTASSSRKALDFLRNNSCDLIIADLIMPDIDGFALCKILRQDAKFLDIPIVVQTYLDQANDRARAFIAGATDFITKPINSAELNARVHIHLERRLIINELRNYKERIENELAIAERIQLSALPRPEDYKKLIKTHNIAISAYTCNSSELGGDMWNLRRLNGGRIAIYSIDFSGHGVNAALNAIRLDALISSTCEQFHDPGQMLDYLHAELIRVIPSGQFATLFYGIINTKTADLHLASAGAPPALYWATAEENKPVPLEDSDLPLGVGFTSYKTKHLAFPKGAKLFLYSDGLTHPFNGAAGLTEAGIIAMTKSTQKSLFFKILRDKIQQEYTKPLADDITMVFIEHADSHE
ncbi:MAG: SpoIIE family protein phosphatase [Holosporales bacterium]|jgi:sigma-B regulation protein RsbU (phosphoserine phosphatase)